MSKNGIKGILQELDNIEIPKEIIDNLENYFSQKDTTYYLSFAGGAAPGLVGNCILLYFFVKTGFISKFSEIWGTSAGAIVAGTYGSGLDVKELLKRLSELKMKDILKFDIRNFFEMNKIEKVGFFHTKRVRRTFKKNLLVDNIEDCVIPVRIIATQFDGKTEKTHVFKQGNLSETMVASLSMPNMFRPKKIEGKLYCDGSLLENIPSESIVKYHNDLNNKNNIAIFSTCFDKVSYNLSDGNLLTKLLSLMDYYCYQTQDLKLKLTRNYENVNLFNININKYNISRSEFHKLSEDMVFLYKQIIEKLTEFVQDHGEPIDYNTWNTTI